MATVKRGKRKALPKDRVGEMIEKLEQIKASLRAKVEHPIHVLKNLFKHRKGVGAIKCHPSRRRRIS